MYTTQKEKSETRKSPGLSDERSVDKNKIERKYKYSRYFTAHYIALYNRFCQ